MNRREEMMLRYKLKLKRRNEAEAQLKKQRHISMLRQSLPKLQLLIKQYKHVKSVLDDSFYKVTRVNPRRLQTPRNYQDYLEKYVNKIRYRENNNSENNNENNYSRYVR
jgi:hypothetical protein